MSNVKFELNREGVAELLKGTEMRQVLSSYAGEVCRRCTAGGVGVEEYESEVVPGRTRAVAYVRPATAHAYYSNLKHNTLLKAVSG